LSADFGCGCVWCAKNVYVLVCGCLFVMYGLLLENRKALIGQNLCEHFTGPGQDNISSLTCMLVCHARKVHILTSSLIMS